MSPSRNPQSPETDRLARARAFLSGRFVLGGLAAIDLGLAGLIAAKLSPITGPELMATQLTFSRDALIATFDRWEAQGRLAAFRNHFDVDLVAFPIGYGLLLASVIAYALDRAGAEHARDRLILLPFVASVLDVLENLGHLRMLDHRDSITQAAVTINALLSTGKDLTLLACFAVVAVLLAKASRQPTRASTK